MVYPDKIDGYTLVIKSEIFWVYRCNDCGAYILNEHKRMGYQTEYLPFNSVITEEKYKELEVLNNIK